MKIRVDDREVKRMLARDKQRIPQRLKERKKEWASKTSTLAKELSPKFESTLANSIRSSSGLKITKVFTNLNYAPFADKGRRPGKMPPVSVVERWAVAHGISPFLLARSIGRKGTKGNKFWQKTLEKAKGQYFKEFIRNLKRDLKKLRLTI